MTHKERAAEIAAVIEAVDGAGKVHTRMRFADSWGAFLQLMQDQSREKHGPIRGWEITRSGPMTPETAPDWTETWMLRHYRGLQDEEATEYEFQDHLDAVVRTFRTAELTWGAIPYGLKINVAEPREFGSVLCHYAECEFTVIRHYDQV